MQIVDLCREIRCNIMSEKQKSLYDVVKENFRVGQRITYLHRIIYVGEHRFKENPTVKQFFEGIIRTVNLQDPDEVLTGFLLYYKNLFVHLVEGSEATILRHLRRLYTFVDEGDVQLGNIKVLIACHHIHQRFFKQWAGRTAVPPTLLEDIDPESDVETTWRNVKTCITKMYRLSAFLYQQTAVNLNVVMDNLSETVPNLLPECAILNFLLGCKSLIDLRKYMDIYFNVSSRKSYHEVVWPMQEDHVPYHLLDPDEYTFLSDMDALKKPEVPDEGNSST